ncbi:MAG: glycosyltransferase family 2 protein, partial [Psychroserpens sp.]|nr:glycosyltransferase family 2 protein [Psychroserpens sp.]
MHRENLEFLEPMFRFNNVNDFHLLIVNQTEKGKELTSDNPKIKVINRFEFGVPKSRRLAMQEASKDICLMADDDIVYQPNLYKIITEAYSRNEDASMISFEAVDEEYIPYADYYPEGKHDKISLTKIFTWVISFRRKDYVDHNITYSPYFGFGAEFEG